MRLSRMITSTVAVLALSSLMALSVFAQEATPEPEPTMSRPQIEVTPAPATYTVRAGDTLFRIALRFNQTTQQFAQYNNITNPNLIYVGQVLRIPGAGQPTPEPPTEVPQVYTVQRGDTLARIAARFNTTIAEIRAINNIPNPNIIFVGQRLNIPGGQTAPPEEAPAPDPEATPEAPVEEADTPDEIIVDEPEEIITDEDDEIVTEPAMIAQFDYGLEVFFDGQDIATLVSNVSQLGMNWVRVRVDWRLLEPVEGEIDFTELDNIVNALESAGVEMLFTVTNAPTWARTSPDENGPPDDLNNFFTFLDVVVNRYVGRIGAYQIWDEPNLRRNWNCERRMCDTDYLFMLGESSALIREVDPSAMVISAGLAPTRFNDRVNAIDDRLYLETMFFRGMGTVIDGVGVHPGGEANPPDARCCEQTPGVESHFENDVFYFLENLEAYRAIVVDYGYEDIPLWVTKFGWGTGEGTDAPMNVNQPHFSVNYTSLSEQAVYIPRAFELGRELGYIGPMFLHNLNGCAISAAGGLPELCYTSLIGADNTPRPAFIAVQAIEKTTAEE